MKRKITFSAFSASDSDNQRPSRRQRQQALSPEPSLTYTPSTDSSPLQRLSTFQLLALLDLSNQSNRAQRNIRDAAYHNSRIVDEAHHRMEQIERAELMGVEVANQTSENERLTKQEILHDFNWESSRENDEFGESAPKMVRFQAKIGVRLFKFQRAVEDWEGDEAEDMMDVDSGDGVDEDPLSPRSRRDVVNMLAK